MWSVHFSQRRTRHAGRGREELLATAAKVIADRGIEHARFSDIADATGVAVSSLQYFFGSREDLLITILEFASQERLRRMDEISGSTANPRERLGSLVKHALDETREDSMLSLEIRRAALRNPELNVLYRQMHEARLGHFRSAMQDGVEQGLFPRTLSIYDASVQIVALTDGLATSLLLEESTLDIPKAQHLAIQTIMAALDIELPQSESA